MNIKKNVYEAYKKICENGLVIGSWGNVSACESDSIVITPSGIPIDELNSEKLVKVKLSGDIADTDYKPSVDRDIQ